jgi:ribosomal protein S18 acetylase RimI-like enzyme
LQHNTKAISVYQNLGFETTREFNCFKQKNEEINLEITNTDIQYIVQKIEIANINNLSNFWDFYPSWQNSFESIQRAYDDFVALGVFAGNELAGYCVFEPVSGDVTQIAVAPQHRRKGVGTLLLNEIIKLNKHDSVKVLNTDVLHYSITKFLEARNMDILVKQFEMIKKLQ